MRASPHSMLWCWLDSSCVSLLQATTTAMSSGVQWSCHVQKKRNSGLQHYWKIIRLLQVRCVAAVSGLKCSYWIGKKGSLKLPDFTRIYKKLPRVKGLFWEKIQTVKNSWSKETHLWSYPHTTGRISGTLLLCLDDCLSCLRHLCPDKELQLMLS